jgi:hypothetical protein
MPSKSHMQAFRALKRYVREQKEVSDALDTHLFAPGGLKNIGEAGLREKDYYARQKKAGAALFSLCTKLAAPKKLLAGSGRAASIGRFRGTATENFIKPPGRSLLGQVVNPRRRLSNAIAAFAR